MRGGEKHLNCRGSVLWRDPWQHDFPFRGLEPRRRGGGQISDLDHVNSIRQSCVEPDPDRFRVKARREGDLQELGLTGSARGRPARIRDLGMRRETGRVRDRQARPPNSPLHRTRDIPMTCETHSATLSVPDH
jgi:hypothetical protein